MHQFLTYFFPLSDVPELPEEVEAVVCDAGDLAEGELRFFPSYQTVIVDLGDDGHH